MGHYGVSQGWSFLVENGCVATPILTPRTSPSTSVPRQQRPYPQHLGDFIGFPPHAIVVILLAICLYSALGGIFTMNRTRHNVEEIESISHVHRRNRASGAEGYIKEIKKKKREGAFECAVAFAIAATTGYFLYSGFTYLG